MKQEEKIKNLVDKIVEEYQPEKVILFGSYAWGEPTEDSDADLFIVKNSGKNSLEMMQEVNRIIMKRNIPMDILVYTAEQLKKREILGDPFVGRILKLGKILYAK